MDDLNTAAQVRAYRKLICGCSCATVTCPPSIPNQREVPTSGKWKGWTEKWYMRSEDEAGKVS